MQSRLPIPEKSARRAAWAIKALSPWAVGAVLLVSFTANAGPRIDTYDAPARRLWTLGGGTTVLKLPVPRQPAPAMITSPGNTEPHAGPEENAAPPDVEAAADWSVTILFHTGADQLPAGRFESHGTYQLTVSAALGRFTPVGEDFGNLALRGATLSLPELSASAPDGATPGSATQAGAASATPAPLAAPATPGTITSASRVTPHDRDPRAPDYASLISADDMSRQQRCLAEAVYFEARSEPAAGQAAVAQVVLNRVRSSVYPDNVCGVVYQNRHRYLGCQFSFACEGKSLTVTEAAPWRQAVRIARDVIHGRIYLPAVGDATHYHARYVRPHWSRVFAKRDMIGQHIFYRPRPGQS